MIKQNQQYIEMLPIWQKCRIAVLGDDWIKKSILLKQIIPPLSSQPDDEYRAMINRATFFNATGRTLDGLLGMVFRKNVVAKVPTSIQPILDDVTLAKDSPINIDDFCLEMLSERLTVGRVGYLIERPNATTQGMSVAQVQALNLRPYVAEYRAESILDWRFDRVNNAAQLVLVRLHEEVEQYEADGVTRKDNFKQERRLLLIDGVYVQQIYREEVQFGEDIIPLMNGRTLNFIPFVCDFSITKPPILDLANVNLSHFRTEVDREHGAHYTAIPTPMFAGFTFGEGESFRLGATGGYNTSNPDATWGFLEFEGAGLSTLKEIKEEKEKQLVILGAKFLDSEKSGVEAEGTVKIRRSGETSVLALHAMKCSRMAQRIIEIMRDWMGVSGDVEIEVNTDYTEAGMSAQDILALFQVMQGGGISQQTFFYNMKHGEMYPEDTTFEEEQERINAQSIGTLPAPTVPQN